MRFPYEVEAASRRNILVTGGAGFIGSHTVKELRRCGYRPIVVDNLSTGNLWATNPEELIEADISDRTAIRDCIIEHKIDAVIHFAASAYVGESVSNPRKYFDNNVSKTLDFLSELLITGVDKIVFSSSCSVYGHPQSLSIREDHPKAPLSPYGESKLFIEKVLHWYGRTNGMQSVCLRFFNAAGADPDGDLGESHAPETHLIPLAIQAALGVQPYLEVYGSDYQTQDGTAVRDYVHVTDLARAHVLALQYLFAGGESMVANLGTGVGCSIRQIVAAIESTLSRPVPCRYLARRIGDADSLIADATYARAVLGWSPVHSDLTQIISSACSWQMRQVPIAAEAARA